MTNKRRSKKPRRPEFISGPNEKMLKRVQHDVGRSA